MLWNDHDRNILGDTVVQTRLDHIENNRVDPNFTSSHPFFTGQCPTQDSSERAYLGVAIPHGCRPDSAFGPKWLQNEPIRCWTLDAGVAGSVGTRERDESDTVSDGYGPCMP